MDSRGFEDNPELHTHQPHRYLNKDGRGVIACVGIFYTISIVSVALRYYSRYSRKLPFLLEDYVILAALVSSAMSLRPVKTVIINILYLVHVYWVQCCWSTSGNVGWYGVAFMGIARLPNASAIQGLNFGTLCNGTFGACRS